MIKTIGIIFVCIFIGVGIFSFSEALSQFRTNKSLSWQINNTYKPKLAKLEKNYARLESEKARIVSELAEAKGTISLLEEENSIITKTINEKNAEIKNLQLAQKEKDKEFADISQRYTEQRKENSMLKDKITAMFLEIKEMRETLSSISDLKDKLRELRGGDKRSEFDDVIQEGMAVVGNGGYLTRNGKSTYSPKVTIRVMPIEG